MDAMSARWERALALTGLALVLGAVILLDTRATQLLVALAGVFLVGAGGWGGAIPGLVPDRRRRARLREETEILLEQVRALDELADEGERRAVARQRERMHAQVERLVDVAGADG